MPDILKLSALYGLNQSKSSQNIFKIDYSTANLSVKAKGALVVAVPALFALACILLTLSTVIIARLEMAKVEEVNFGLRQIQAAVEEVTGEFADTVAHSGSKAKLSPLASKGLNLEKYPSLKSDTASVKGLIVRLEDLIRQASGQAQLASMHPLFLDWLHDGQNTILEIQNRQIRTSQARIDQLHAYSRALLFVSLLSVVCGSILAIIVALLFYGDLHKRLRLLKDHAVLLAVNQNAIEPLRGKDELVRADRALRLASRKIDDFMKIQFAILHRAAEVFCSLDQNYRLIVCGDSIYDLFCQSGDALHGRSVLALYSEQSKSEILVALNQARSGKIARFDVSLSSPGLKQWHRWTVRWAVQPQQYLCVIINVSELKRLESARDMLLAAVNHDLRTPLSSLNVSLAIVREGKRGDVSARTQASLARVSQLNNQLKVVLDDFLLTTKLSSGNFDLELEVVSLFDFCHSHVAAVAVECNSEIFFSCDLQMLLRVFSLLSLNMLSKNCELFSLKADGVANSLEFELTFVSVAAAQSKPNLQAKFSRADEMLLNSLLRVQKIILAETVSASGRSLVLKLDDVVLKED